MKNQIRCVVKTAGRVLLPIVFAGMAAGIGGCGKAPELLSAQVVVELGEEPDPYAGNYAELGEREAAEAVVDFSAVNTGAVGVYPATLIYKKQEVPFEVRVRDTTAPKLELKRQVTATVGEPLYASDVVNRVEELSGQAELFLIKVEEDSPGAGEYEETEEELAESTEVQENGDHRSGDTKAHDGGVGASEDTEAALEETAASNRAGVSGEVSEGLEAEPEDQTGWREEEADAEHEAGAKEQNEVSDGESFVLEGVLCTNGAVVYEQIGEYELTVTAVDASGNSVAETVQVTVGEPPVFSGIRDREIVAGDAVTDYLEDVTAVDCEGRDITERIICDSTAVDPEEEGEYAIVYMVYDEQGFLARQTAMVTVRQKDSGNAKNGAAEAGTSSGGAGGRSGVSQAARDGKTTNDSNDADDSGAVTGGTSSTGNRQNAGQSSAQNPSGGSASQNFAGASGGSQGSSSGGSTGGGQNPSFGGNTGSGQNPPSGGSTGSQGSSSSAGTGGQGSSFGAGTGGGQNPSSGGSTGGQGPSSSGSAEGSQGSSSGGSTGGQDSSSGGSTGGQGSSTGGSAGGSQGSSSEGNTGGGQPSEGQELPSLGELGFEEYVPEAGTGADDGTDLGGTSDWY